MRTLILYAFHHVNKRVLHFIAHGVFEHPDYDFIFICSSAPQMLDGAPLRSHIPEYAHLMYRDTKGFDFGAWSDGLLVDDRYLAYDAFVFVNSSVLGPLTPMYFKGNWVDSFT